MRSGVLPPPAISDNQTSTFKRQPVVVFLCLVKYKRLSLITGRRGYIHFINLWFFQHKPPHFSSISRSVPGKCYLHGGTFYIKVPVAYDGHVVKGILKIAIFE